MSLQKQTNNCFTILFIDYGSSSSYSLKLQEILKEYPNCIYQYSFTENQPWSRAKAINIGLRLVQTEYVFIADIDIIFRDDFVDILQTNKSPAKSIYFQVGFVDKNYRDFSADFHSIPISFKSKAGAQGLSFFYVSDLLKINGFDEFYHFWGSEDEDIHSRLEMNGNTSIFYEEQLLLLHQWHPTYRSSERARLTKDLQLTGVVQLNYQHLKSTIKARETIRNSSHWGYSIAETEHKLLFVPVTTIYVNIRKSEIDHFIYFTMRQKLTNKVKYVFCLDPSKRSLKSRIKKIFKKNVPTYYTLKEVNDFLLISLIANSEIKNYSYIVADDLQSLTLIF